MSTRRFLWALAFFSTSALGGAAALRSAPPAWTPELLKLVELEGQLASTENIYLALDPARKALDIRARGVLLERLPVIDLLLLAFEPFLGEAAAPKLTLPAIWTVTQGPGDTDREVIAPVALKPYPMDGEEEEDEAPAPSGSTSTVDQKADKSGPPAKPTSYRVQLDNGWQLYVVNRRPDRGFLRRSLDAVRDGWQRARGEQPNHPPLVTLVVSEEAAERLHHLFKAKMPILVGNAPD